MVFQQKSRTVHRRVNNLQRELIYVHSRWKSVRST